VLEARSGKSKIEFSALTAMFFLFYSQAQLMKIVVWEQRMKKREKTNEEKLVLDFENTGKTLEFSGINAMILRKLFYEENQEWLTAVSLESKYKKVKKQRILQIKICPRVA